MAGDTFLQRLRQEAGQPFKNGVITGDSPVHGLCPFGGWNCFSKSSSRSGTPERPVRRLCGVWRCRCPPSGWRPFCSRSLLGMNGTGQKQNCQSAGEYHAMSKKRAFHHLWNGKTGMSLIQTHLFRLSLFSSAWDLHPFPDSVFSGKIIPEQFFCRKSLHARFGNDRFPPSSTGRTKTKVKGVLAQLVERFNGIEEVSGSNPLCSTK